MNDGRSVSRPEFNLILDYRELSDVGKKFAESMLATLLETERKAKDEEYRKTYRLFGKAATKAAAGTGCDFVDSPLEPIFIKRNTRNKRADSIVEVSGDSMLPVYHNGDLVYVQYTQGIDPGEDVVCSSADGMTHSRYKFILWQEKPFTTDTFVQAHIKAFAFFGGRPQEMVYDQDKILAVSENNGDIIYTEGFQNYVNEVKFDIFLCHGKPKTAGY